MFRKPIVSILVCAFFAASFPAQTKFNYPKPRPQDQVDDYHGVMVADPCRWMEEADKPEMREWIEAENKLTQSYIPAIPERERIKTRLTEIWNYERYSAPSKIAPGFYI